MPYLQISAHAHEDHLGREPTALEHGHGANLLKFIRGTAPPALMQQSHMRGPDVALRQQAWSDAQPDLDPTRLVLSSPNDHAVGPPGIADRLVPDRVGASSSSG